MAKRTPREQLVEIVGEIRSLDKVITPDLLKEKEKRNLKFIDGIRKEE